MIQVKNMIPATSDAMTGMMIRVKDKHRVMLKKLAKKLNKGEAEVVRDLIEKAFMREI